MIKQRRFLSVITLILVYVQAQLIPELVIDTPVTIELDDEVFIQYSFFVPEDASQIDIQLSSPDDFPFFVASSTDGPICEYFSQTQTNSNFYNYCSYHTSTFTSGTSNTTISFGPLSSTPTYWKTGVTWHFGMTTSLVDQPLQSNATITATLSISTCPPGFQALDDPTDCNITLVPLNPSGNTTFEYSGPTILQTTIANETSYIILQWSQNDSIDDPLVVGSSLGIPYPSGNSADCQGSDISLIGSMYSMICVPRPGQPLYFLFDLGGSSSDDNTTDDEESSFDVTVQLSQIVCPSGLTYFQCMYPSAIIELPTNGTGSFQFPLIRNATQTGYILGLRIPAGSDPINVTLSNVGSNGTAYYVYLARNVLPPFSSPVYFGVADEPQTIEFSQLDLEDGGTFWFDLESNVDETFPIAQFNLVGSPMMVSTTSVSTPISETETMESSAVRVLFGWTIFVLVNVI